MTRDIKQDISSVAALGELARERRSGVLALKRGKAGAHVCLQDGRVVYATSNLRKFQPARWLVDANLATAATLKDLGKVAGTKQLVDSLVGEGPLSRSDFLLRWTAGPSDSRYNVTVTAEDLTPIADATALTEPEFTVPESSLATLTAGEIIIWQVETVTPDGRRTQSLAFLTRIE